MHPGTSTRARCWRRLRNWNRRLGEFQCFLTGFSCGVLKRSSLEPQQECLGCQPASITAQRSSVRQHAMTGNHDCDRIVMVRLADGTVRVGASHCARDLCVTARPAVRDTQQLVPALLLEVGAAEIEP